MLLTVVSHFFLEGVYFSSTKPNRRTVILSSNTERLPISPKRKQSSKPWITALHSTDLPALVRKSRIYTLELVKSCSWCGLLEKQLSFIAPTAVDICEKQLPYLFQWHGCCQPAVMLHELPETSVMEWGTCAHTQKQRPAPNDSISWTILSIASNDSAHFIKKL